MVPVHCVVWVTEDHSQSKRWSSLPRVHLLVVPEHLRYQSPTDNVRALHQSSDQLLTVHLKHPQTNCLQGDKDLVHTNRNRNKKKKKKTS